MLSLVVNEITSKEEIQVGIDRLVIAGYTGRDVHAVRAHIDELAAVGIPPPPSIPMFFELDPTLLNTKEVQTVSSASTSGEVEPVLLRIRGQFFLGVGSDHTDRVLEREDIGRSKGVCPKPIGPTVIALGSGESNLSWSDVRVTSYADGELYQEGALDVLRSPFETFSSYWERKGSDDGCDMALFGGTIPLLGEFKMGEVWSLELTIANRSKLSHRYQVSVSSS